MKKNPNRKSNNKFLISFILEDLFTYKKDDDGSIALTIKQIKKDLKLDIMGGTRATNFKVERIK